MTPASREYADKYMPFPDEPESDVVKLHLFTDGKSIGVVLTPFVDLLSVCHFRITAN